MTSHLIYYPKTAEGQFLSISLMHYGDVMDKSKDWDSKTPYILGNELFMNSDLTEGDLVIRQINCSKIIDRLLF